MQFSNQTLEFCIFLFIFKHNIKEKTVGFSRIRTLIVGVEGEHADDLTTTTAHQTIEFISRKWRLFSVLNAWPFLIGSCN